MNLQITTFRLNRDFSKIQVTNLIGEQTEFSSLDFFEWFITWSNDQHHGVWSHDIVKGMVSRSFTEIGWDIEREETFEIPNRADIYTYQDFFKSYVKQDKDLFTRYTMSCEGLVWVGKSIAA